MRNKSYHSFLIIWAGQLLSGLGTGMSGFALGVYVFGKTNSAASFAAVIMSLFLPSILLRPVGGVLADRLDRRVMIILGDIGSALGILSILLALGTGRLAPWHIYLGVAISSAFTALQNPAYKASLTDLLNEEEYARAGGLIQLASSAQHLLSPVAGGFLLAFGGLGAILILDLATFAAAVAAVLTIEGTLDPVSQGEKGTPLADLIKGWRTLTSTQGLMDIVFIVSLVTFFVGVLQTLFAPMMLTLTSPEVLGTTQSISATGMVVSSLLVGVYGLRGDLTRILRRSLGAAGVFLALMGVGTSVVWITASFFLFFAALPVINTCAEVLIRTSVSSERQGRIWGLIGLLTQIGYIVAYLTAGILADQLFNPLFLPQGTLAGSLGRLIGTGPGRGIGLILILSGLGLTISSFAGRDHCRVDGKGVVKP